MNEKNLDAMIQLINERIASVTGRSAADIDIEQPFMNMGIESLQAVNIISGLGEKLGRSIAPTLMFDYPTVAALADYLVNGASEGAGSAAAAGKTSGSVISVSEPVAIVGVGCRFPQATSPEQFWHLLREGVDAITEAPTSRGELRGMTPTWGGFLDDVDCFDNDAFGIADVEALKMDPQQRLLLQVAWEAIESSGRAPSELRQSRTGVYIGISSSDYSILGARASGNPNGANNEAIAKSIFDATGNAHCIAANRISYVFDLRGPSVSIDTACSSSLVAIHQACQSLKSGESDFALAGGVNVILEPSLTTAFAAAQMLAPDGRCKTFADSANGYVRGEGVAVVALKRLADAVRDGDSVWAVIRGSAVNQDGRSSGLTAPNGPAQEAVIHDALRSAELNAEDIEYVEAHGTGTPLGDPIEFLALSRVMGARGPGEECWVGSVKTNIGHLEAAAGVAGVIKAVLALRNRFIPRSLHFQRLNPKIGEHANNLRVAATSRPWGSSGRPRRAGVSSFGFGGTNAHVILEEYTPDERPSMSKLTPDARRLGPRLLLTLSAAAEEPLRDMARDYQEILRRASVEEAELICAAARRARNDLPVKLAVHGADVAEVCAHLHAFATGQSEMGWASARVTKKQKAKIAFLFTGQGAQSLGMGMRLYEEFATFRSAFEDCCEGFNRYFAVDLLSLLRGAENDAEALLSRTDYAQAALFSLQYALGHLLRQDFGVEADFVFGHSLGELSAACLAGVMSLPEAIRLVTIRGQLMQQTNDGAMAVVFASEEQVLRLKSNCGADLDIGAINGPANFVVSGTKESVDRAETICQQENIRFTRLRVTKAFHSSLMDPVLPLYEKAIAQMPFRAPLVPFVSGLRGEFLKNGEAHTATYWRNQLRQPTQFLRGMQELAATGISACVEIGPHPALLPMAQSCVKNAKIAWIATQNRKVDGATALYQALAELAVSGYASGGIVVGHASGAAANALDINLPKTRFQKKRFWAFAATAVQVATAPAVRAAKTNEVQFMNQANEEKILNELRTMVGRLLQMDPAEFNVDEPLIDLGADSLLLLNAVQTIKDQYHVSIAISDVFQEMSTLRKMATFIAQNTQAPASVTAPVAAPNVNATQASQTLSPSFAMSIDSLSTSAMSTASSGAVSGNVQDLIQRQLQLMSMQLQLLQGHTVADLGLRVQTATQAAAQKQQPARETPASQPARETPAANQPEREKKGVLGNFKTFADREAMAVEDERKAKYVESLIKTFNARTAKTKEHTQKYRRALADNRVSAGFRPNTKEIVYPIICQRAKGARFVDFDGNEYIDYSMGFGVNLFGHSPEFINTAVQQQFELGMAVGPQSVLAGPVAQLMAEITAQERVAFCNSGTEAVMTALRLARAVTKREKIVLFDGSYHGHSDAVLARSDARRSGIPVAPGVTRGAVGDVLVLDYGTPESLEIIRREAGNLAAVLVEPVQSRFPEHQPLEFLRELRTLTEKSGTALIFDEVITGFRIAPGGSQEHFGIRADLASYGKILGGGFPIGAIAGRGRFMDPIDGGHWNFGDSSFPQAEMTFFAGTFSKHPLAMAAAEAVLRKLKDEGRAIIGDLNARTDRLRADLNAFFASRGLDLHVNNFGSLFRFKANANLDLFFYNLNLRGMYVWEGRNLFLATAHSEDDVRQFIQVVKDTTDELIDYGFFKKKALSAAVTPEPPRAERVQMLPQLSREVWPLLSSQTRFQKLSLQGDDGEAASHICLAVKMKGPLQKDLLERSLAAVVAHYDAFRLRFDLRGGQQWLAADPGFHLECIDVSKTEIPWQELEQKLRDHGRRPFQLDAEMPARFFLFDVVEETAVFALICHHIALDGWSLALFIEEVARVYTALEKGDQVDGGEVAKTLAFAEFLEHPEKFGPPRKTEAAEKFWREKWSGFQPSYIRWPNAMSATTPSLKGQRVVFDIEYGLYTKIKKASQVAKVSPLMYMLAAFAKLMREIDGSPLLTIATPAGNRDLEGADKMIGNCANLLPVRLALRADESHADFLKRLKSEMVPCYQHMMYPYEAMEAAVGRPLFNVSFNVEPASELPDFGAVSLFVHPFPVTASEFDLTVNLTDLEYFYHGEADFRTAVLDDTQVVKWMDRFVEILRDDTKTVSK